MLQTAISPISADLPALSVEAVVVATILVAAGAVLWAFGRRILRPAFLTTGGLIGAAAGYVAAITFEAPVPPWTVAIAGGIVVAVFSWLAYRPAIGLTLALLLGAACPVGVIAWAGQRGVDLVNPPVGYDKETNAIQPNGRDIEAIIQDMRRTLEILRDADAAIEGARRVREGDLSPASEGDEGGTGPGESDDEEGAAEPAWRAEVSTLANGIVEDIRLRWDAAPDGVRRSIALSAACGAVLGFFIGLSLPAIAASVMTALAGSAMALGGGTIVANQTGVDQIPFLDASPLTWLIAWLVVSAAGVGVQWTFRPKRADKAED